MAPPVGPSLEACFFQHLKRRAYNEHVDEVERGPVYNTSGDMGKDLVSYIPLNDNCHMLDHGMALALSII